MESSIYQVPRPYLQIVFSSQKQIHCSFITLAIKTEAIKQKHPDGLKYFVEKYSVKCNRELAFKSVVVSTYLDELIMELKECGIEPEKEFICFSAISDASKSGDGVTVEICDWLKGVAHNRGLSVYYEGEQTVNK